MNSDILAVTSEELDIGMNAGELTNAYGRLEERVALYAKAFWCVVVVTATLVGCGVKILWDMHSSIARLEQGQANATSSIVGSLLKRTPATRNEAAQTLGAAATLLRASRIGTVRPSPSMLQSVAVGLSRAQTEYPNLPEFWRATGEFINYKSRALLPPSQEKVLESASRVFRCDEVRQQGSDSMLFSKCTLDLETVRVNLPGIVTFMNCVIRYRGGPIEIKRMQFINCIFRFEINAIPPRDEGSALMQMALSVEPNIAVSLS